MSMRKRVVSPRRDEEKFGKQYENERNTKNRTSEEETRELERIICFISHRALRAHLNYVTIIVLKQIIPLALNHCLEFLLEYPVFC